MSESNAKDTTLTGEAKAIDKSFTDFIKVSLELHDKVHGQMKQAPWSVRLSKLSSSYTQSDNPLGWKKMFEDFYTLHHEDISKDIFMELDDDEGDVNDGWIKDNKNEESGGGNKKKGGWKRKISCKGLVIYFSDKPGARDFSIALTEIYKDAISLSNKKGDNDVVCASYPARILYGIYCLFRDCISKEDPTWPQLKKNAHVLKVYIDEILPNGTESSEIGSGVKGFSNIISQVMKSAGIDTGDMDAGGLEEVLSNTLKGDTVGKMGKVFSKIVDGVSNGDGDSDNPGDIMDRLGDVLKDDEVRDLLTSATKETTETMGNLASSIPTAASVGKTTVVEEGDGNASDQE